MGAKGWVAQNGMIFPQQFSDLGIGVIEIAKDQCLALTTCLDTGWKFANFDAANAEVAFFNDAAHSPWFVRVQVADIRRGFSIVETAHSIGTGGHAEPATDAAVIIHDHNTILVAEGSLGRTNPDTGWVVAMVAEDWQFLFFGGLVSVQVGVFMKSVFVSCHPNPLDFVFGIGDIRYVVIGMAGLNNFFSQGRIVPE